MEGVLLNKIKGLKGGCDREGMVVVVGEGIGGAQVAMGRHTGNKCFYRGQSAPFHLETYTHAPHISILRSEERRLREEELLRVPGRKERWISFSEKDPR